MILHGRRKKLLHSLPFTLYVKCHINVISRSFTEKTNIQRSPIKYRSISFICIPVFNKPVQCVQSLPQETNRLHQILISRIPVVNMHVAAGNGGGTRLPFNRMISLQNQSLAGRPSISHRSGGWCAGKRCEQAQKDFQIKEKYGAT